jgi:hypothetical protein
MPDKFLAIITVASVACPGRLPKGHPTDSVNLRLDLTYRHHAGGQKELTPSGSPASCVLEDECPDGVKCTRTISIAVYFLGGRMESFIPLPTRNLSVVLAGI